MERKQKAADADVGLGSKLAQSVSGSMRTIKVAMQERGVVADRFVRPLPLSMYEQAQMGRAIARLISAPAEIRDVHRKQEIVLRCSAGREQLINYVKNVMNDVAKSHGNEKLAKKVSDEFEKRIQSLTKDNASYTPRGFLVALNKTIDESMKAAGLGKLSGKVKSSVVAYFVGMHTIKGKGGVAVVDPNTCTAYVASKGSNEVNVVSVRQDDAGSEPNINDMKELLNALKDMGFANARSKLADIWERVIITRAVRESMTSGTDLSTAFKRRLEEEMAKDSEFAVAYKEKSLRETMKSLNAAVMYNTLFETFTRLPTKFVAAFARVVAAISRYIPVAGAVAAASAESAALMAELGDQIADRIRSLTNVVWSLKDLSAEGAPAKIEVQAGETVSGGRGAAGGGEGGGSAQPLPQPQQPPQPPPPQQQQQQQPQPHPKHEQQQQEKQQQTAQEQQEGSSKQQA